MPPAALIGASVVGGALSGAAGKKTKTTVDQTQTSNPYAPTIPYLNDILGQAQTLYNNNPTPSYGPSAVPNAGATTTAAQNAIVDASKAPTGLIPQAQTALGSTISGSMLNAGPGNAALTNVANGGAANPATGNAAALAGGYSNPANGFNAALMTQGYNDPSKALYGQMAGMQANDTSSGLFGQAANAQAGQGATGLYSDLAGMQAGQGATNMYANLGNMTGNADALGMYANIGNTQANPNANAQGVYSGLATGSDPNSQVFGNMAQGNFNQGANTYEQLANRQYTDPQTNAMADYLTPFANGSLSSVESNPYLSGMGDIIQRRLSDQVGSMFGAGNRYGSGANQQVLARETGDALTNLYGQAYESNMGRQLSAAGSLAGIGENRAGRDLASMQAGAAGMEGQRLANLGQQFQGAQAGVNSSLAGAQGLAQQSQFADQFAAQNAQAGAAGTAGVNQFLDQYKAQNLGQAAAGIQNQGQFADQFNASNLSQGAAGIQNQSQFGDQFNQNALLAGAQGLQGNQQFADQYGLSALGQGAQGLGTGAANQITAQQGAANSLSNNLGNQFQAALSGTGLQAQIGQNNTGNILSAAGALNQQFSNERENQLNATNNAPALDQARYLDAQQALLVGQQQDALKQQQAAEAQARYQYENNQAPYAALDQYLSTVGSIAGLGGTTTNQGTSVTKQGGGLLNGIAGGIGGLAGGLGGLASGVGSGGAALGGMSSGFGGGAMTGFSMPQVNPFSLMAGNYGLSGYGGNKLTFG